VTGERLRLALTVDLGDRPGLGPVVLRGVLVAPAAPRRAPTVLAYCQAGGRCTTGYHDLRPEGLPGYSMLEHLADAGMVAVALDHPGIGTSDRLPDVFAATPSRVAAAHHDALGVLRAGLADGTLAPGLPALPDLRVVGIGHSMGGMLTDVQQARHGSFDAVVGAGHSSDGGFLRVRAAAPVIALADPATNGARIAELARARFAPGAPPPPAPADGPPLQFFTPDVPEAVRRAFAEAGTGLLFTCGLASMIPASTDEEKAAIRTPVLLALGDRDLVRDLPGAAARYRAADDVTLVRLRDTAHCHNQAASRTVLWDRIVRWCDAVLP